MKRVELDGTWIFGKADEEERLKIKVPGTVLSGLLENGKIEDPYYRTNEYETRDLFWNDYEFERDFLVEKELLKEEQLELVCEGLDTLTDIYVNGQLIGTTDNMHRTWKFSVKDVVREGTNHIRILFHSVLKYIENYQSVPEKEIHRHSPDVIKGHQLIRKAHSMFGWDWGPQLPDAGIFRTIYLQAHTGIKIEELYLRQNHESGQVRIQAEVLLAGKEKAGERVKAYITEEKKEEKLDQTESLLHSSSSFIKVSYSSYKECQTLTLNLTVHDPKLWWPNDYGEQPLYCFHIQIENEEGEIIDQQKKVIGLRTLTVSQEKDEWGSEFAIKINGIKIFTKGGNYIPEDCLYTRITKERQQFILQSCVDAHFNMVRIWGGGYYPTNDFYDLCDHMGLIVWQDLMFACNVYDVTQAFEENTVQEVMDNVKRLRHHASLGLWCGNNEIEAAWCGWDDFQTESKYLRADYIKLFEYLLPKVIKQTDPDRFYWISSPSSGGCFDAPQDENRGDTHYWDVWHGLKPFTDYQKHYFRFCSEFGFQSFPSLKTVETYTKAEDRNIFSEVMESHQKNNAANGRIQYYLSENFKYPRDFGSLLYLSQTLQAMAIKYGVEHWRRNMGRCMGALYWQVNDNWPVASWSSIDYFGRWKALHYFARHFYAPVAVSMMRDEERLCIAVANDSLKEQHCSGILSIKDMELNVLEQIPYSGIVPPLSSVTLLEMDCQEILHKYEKRSIFAVAEVQLPDGSVSREVEVFVPYKHLQIEQAQIVNEITEQKEYFEINLSADHFAAFVELDFIGVDAIFSDNYFFITSRDAIKIQVWKKNIYHGTITNVKELQEKLTIRSLVDTF